MTTHPAEILAEQPEPVRKWVRNASWTALALGCGYVLYALRMLWLYHLTCVHGDFWFMYDNLLSQPFPANILALENAHSMAVPKILWLFNLWVFKGSETTHYLFTLLLLGWIAALLIRLSGWQRRTAPTPAQALLMVASLLATFWLAKLGILNSAGFTVTCSLPIIGLLLALLAVVRPGLPAATAPKWWLLLTGCALASFSFGTGLAVWPAMVVLVWCRNARWREVAVVVAGMLVCAVLIGKVIPTCFPGPHQPVPNISPAENIMHWLMLLGSPLGNTWAGLDGAELVIKPLGIAFGTVGALLAAACLLRLWQRRQELSLPEWTGAALLLFSGCASVLIALGRTTFFRLFKNDPFSSRYLCWTSFFWLALLWLLSLWLPRRSLKTDVLYLTLAAACLVLVWPAHHRMCLSYADNRAGNEFVAASVACQVAAPGYSLFGVSQPKLLHLDAILREKGWCYYTRPAYAAVDQPLEPNFQIRAGTQPATIGKPSVYSSLVLKKRAVRIAGEIFGPGADAILLVDEHRIIRGAGCFGGAWEPFSDVERNRFVAFAPLPPRNKPYHLWAVRGKECQELIAASPTPARSAK